VLDLRPFQHQLHDLRGEVARQREDANQAVAIADDKVAIADAGETALCWIEGMLMRAGVHVEPTFQLDDATPDEARGDQETPTGMRAVRIVMAEDPERAWSPGSIFAVLGDRGWLSPNAREPRRGVESCLSRLFARGEIERLGPGRYRLRKEVTHAAQDSGFASPGDAT
jgi:hypothetical protein